MGNFALSAAQGAHVGGSVVVDDLSRAVTLRACDHVGALLGGFSRHGNTIGAISSLWHYSVAGNTNSC